MEFKVFKWVVSVKVRQYDVNARIVDIVNKRMESKSVAGVSLKIERIKILRQADVSKLMIENGLVPEEDIRKNDDGTLFVGLKFAKDWVEVNF